MKTILITGQTGLITTKILKQLSGRFSVVLTTEDAKRKEEVCRVYCTKAGTASFEQLFQAYDIEAVWHISAYADMGGGSKALQELSSVLEQCRKNHIQKLLVLSSSHLSMEQKEEEESILFAEEQGETLPALLRAPGIVTDGNRHTSLGRLFSGAYHGNRKIRFPETEEDFYEFLPMTDIANLLKKITLSAPETGIYQLPGEYVIAADQLAAEVSAISKRSRLVSDGSMESRTEDSSISQLSRKYSYFAKDQKQLEFRQLYEEYAEEERERSGGLVAKVKEFLHRIPGPLVKVLDIVVLFILAEILSKYTSEFVYFKEIDVRLIYIFLIATFHGLKSGVVASLAECVVLFYQYRMLGIYGLQLFYNVENWIPFALCIITGAVTGYFSDLREDERELVDKENALLREKYLFLNDMYNVSSEVRDEYRRQILTFENSYGKIYDAVERMTADTIGEVCTRAQEVLGKLLDNPSVCLYQWEPSRQQARLCASSESYNAEGRKVLDKGTMTAMFDTLQEGKIHINTQLDPGCPMYGASLLPRAAGQEETCYSPVLVLVWDALPEQMNDYYANQFEILCGLTHKALDRAALMEHIAAGQHRDHEHA